MLVHGKYGSTCIRLHQGGDAPPCQIETEQAFGLAPVGGELLALCVMRGPQTHFPWLNQTDNSCHFVLSADGLSVGIITFYFQDSPRG